MIVVGENDFSAPRVDASEEDALVVVRLKRFLCEDDLREILREIQVCAIAGTVEADLGRI